MPPGGDRVAAESLIAWSGGGLYPGASRGQSAQVFRQRVAQMYSAEGPFMAVTRKKSIVAFKPLRR